MQKSPPRRGYRWQLASLCAVIVVACAAVVAWNFPARWAMVWVEPYLHGVRLQQVHGSLWQGRADRVVLPDGRNLGHASWQVSRRVVYAVVPIQVDLDGPHLTFSADVRMLEKGQSRLDNVKLRADLAAWPDVWMDLAGTVQMTADHVLLQDGWPLQLDLHARWDGAAMRSSIGPVALGELDLVATASAGVIDARFHDAGEGPLQVTGQLLASPLGWRFDAQLRQRQANPVLKSWLEALGATDAAGVVHLQRSGGVVMTPPVTSPAPASGAPRVGPARPGRT